MVVVNNIDYVRLVSAINFYSSKGFKYIDLDWTIPSEISEITKPVECKDTFIGDKVLVGSAEQTFMTMLMSGKLEQGRYCGITPCFRDDNVDELHNRYFMKVELIDTKDVTITSLWDIINSCEEFFKSYMDVAVVKVKNVYEHKVIDTYTYDIVDLKHGIELGSYGIRQYKDYKWIFATGLAEPRFSKVLKYNQTNDTNTGTKQYNITST